MRSTIFVLCVLSLALPLYSQSTGTITGFATYSGGPVSVAAVQAKNLETGTVYSATAGLLGNYTIAQLPAGKYQITATSFGFKPYERADAVTVAVGQSQIIDIPMGDFIS